jgi:uncharacterized membrane protein YdjX (TVP38/TMEM64 family)
MAEIDLAKPKRPYKLIILGIIIVTGVILHQSGVFDWYRILEVGEQYAHLWWFPPLIIIVKAVLYVFALPGSSMYWVAGVFFEPLAATVILVIGGLGGAIGGYFFSRRMSGEMEEKIQTSRFFRILRNHSDFATLSAIRTLPNFPHSIINYGSGLLHVPLPRFIVSTLIGFTAKSYLYASAIHHAATAEDASDVVQLQTILPLIGLTILFVAGKLISKRVTERTPEPTGEPE